MGLSVKKNLGGLTGREENVQEEPTISKTKPHLQKRSKKVTEKREVAKRKSIEEELRELTKRRKTEEEEEVEEKVPKMVRLTMKNLRRPKLELVEDIFEAPAVKKESVDFSQVKKENVHIFGVASQVKQVETIILF